MFFSGFYQQLKNNLYIRRTLKNNSIPKSFSNEVFEVNNWVLSAFIIKKIIPIVGIYPYPLNELILMTASVCRLKPTHIFEWGTNIGKSARIFYETAKHFNIDTIIHSVDLPDHITHNEHPGKKRGKLVKSCKNVVLHQGDGLNVSLEIVKKVKDNSKLLFFLDGDHSYESVLRELTFIINALPFSNILIHDTFYQTNDSGYNVGPFLAINHVLETSKNNYGCITSNTGLPGMTLLYSKKCETN